MTVDLTEKYEWLDNCGNLLLYGYLLGDDIVECREEDFPEEVDAVVIIDSWTRELAFVAAEDVWG